ncbi:unnamed protein product [Triticum turgidum subsp. durum]|uniref:CCHC-type domain-containing protein n=1 Tax=Triticum turgidum subsp. durum TaxID=4567 RepID=A0A9R0XX27_TRITD|nr:unnamed protein product [Triticum turgidum subsp. durum]
MGCEEEMAMTLPPPAMLWASAADDDDDEDDEEELAPQTPPAATNALDSGGMCVGHDADTNVGWQEVLPWRGPRRMNSSPSSTMAPRPIPAWLRGRCYRCYAHGHRVAVCKEPLRCSRCLENGHRARGCCNRWRPLSSLPGTDVPLLSQLDVVHRPALASSEGPMTSALPSKVLQRGSWASVVSGTVGSPTSLELMLQSALADQTALLQGCLARVESFLERAEAALSRLSLAPAMLQTSLTSHSPCAVGVCSAADRGVELYGSFSPRVGDNSSLMPTSHPMLSSTESESIAVLVAPVLQVMPELRELCLNLSVDTPTTSGEGQDPPLSSEQLEVPMVDDAKGKASVMS